MSILVGQIEFEGPYLDMHELRDEPGLCAILSPSEGEDDFELFQVLESSSIRSCLEGSAQPMNALGDEKSSENLYLFVHYTPGVDRAGRLEIKQQLLDELEEQQGYENFEPPGL
jgi:hypothetical protein